MFLTTPINLNDFIINMKGEHNEKGKRHGIWTSYYSNGQLGWIGKYINGQQSGLWEDFYSNGKIESIEFFI